MNLLRKLVGEKIRVIRKMKGLTQEELAEKAQLMYQYISGVERGSRNISLDSLDKILAALGVGYEEVFAFGSPSSFIIKEDEKDKDYILAIHQELLRERNLEEIKAVHRITQELLQTFDRNKP